MLGVGLKLRRPFARRRFFSTRRRLEKTAAWCAYRPRQPRDDSPGGGTGALAAGGLGGVWRRWGMASLLWPGRMAGRRPPQAVDDATEGFWGRLPRVLALHALFVTRKDIRCSGAPHGLAVSITEGLELRGEGLSLRKVNMGRATPVLGRIIMKYKA